MSYLLVPMDQSGVEIRPIRQITGEGDFNEVFFNGAVTAEENVVGEPGKGWQVAMGTLSFERGVSTLAQQMNFSNELAAIVDSANSNGQASLEPTKTNNPSLIATASNRSITASLSWTAWSMGV